MVSPRERLQALLRAHCECRWHAVRATWPWPRRMREWINDRCRPVRPLRLVMRWLLEAR